MGLSAKTMGRKELLKIKLQSRRDMHKAVINNFS